MQRLRGVALTKLGLTDFKVSKTQFPLACCVGIRLTKKNRPILKKKCLKVRAIQFSNIEVVLSGT